MLRPRSAMRRKRPMRDLCRQGGGLLYSALKRRGVEQNLLPGVLQRVAESVQH